MGRRWARPSGPSPGPVVGARIDIDTVGVYGIAAVETDYLVNYTVSNPDDVDDTSATLVIKKEGIPVDDSIATIGPFTSAGDGGTIQYRFKAGSEDTGYTFEVTGNAEGSNTSVWPYITEVVTQYDRGYADFEAPPPGTYDVMIFTGQSNMVGRGTGSEITAYPPPGTAYTFNYGEWRTRPMTNAFKHYTEEAEGSMITPFVASYIQETGRKVIAIPCGKGAEFVAQWLPGNPLNTAVKTAIQEFKDWNDTRNLDIGSITFHWNQGERDGKNVGSAEQYIQEFITSMEDIRDNSAYSREDYDYFFIHRVGCGFYPTDQTGKWVGYLNVLRAQSAIPANPLYSDFYKVGYLSLAAMKFENGYMQSDATHFNQDGYNRWGEQSGKIVADAMTKGEFVDPLKASNDEYSLYVLGTELDVTELLHISTDTASDTVLKTYNVANPGSIRPSGNVVFTDAPIQLQTPFNLQQSEGLYVARTFQTSPVDVQLLSSEAVRDTSNVSPESVTTNADGTVDVKFRRADDGADYAATITGLAGTAGQAFWNQSGSYNWVKYDYSYSDMSQPPGISVVTEFDETPAISNQTSIKWSIGAKDGNYANVRVFNGYLEPTVVILSMPSSLI